MEVVNVSNYCKDLVFNISAIQSFITEDVNNLNDQYHMGFISAVEYVSHIQEIIGKARIMLTETLGEEGAEHVIHQMFI